VQPVEIERAARPVSWRDDSLPGMREVREAFVEAILDWRRSSRFVALTNDDR
jgi:hypothetical protein